MGASVDSKTRLVDLVLGQRIEGQVFEQVDAVLGERQLVNRVGELRVGVGSVGRRRVGIATALVPKRPVHPDSEVI